MRVGILLTRGKHLHDYIISIRGEVWVHTTRLTCHLPLKCLCKARKMSGRVFVRYGYRFCLILRFFLFDFETVPTVWYFLFFILFVHFITFLSAHNNVFGCSANLYYYTSHTFFYINFIAIKILFP